MFHFRNDSLSAVYRRHPNTNMQFLMSILFYQWISFFIFCWWLWFKISGLQICQFCIFSHSRKPQMHVMCSTDQLETIHYLLKCSVPKYRFDKKTSLLPPINDPPPSPALALVSGYGISLYRNPPEQAQSCLTWTSLNRDPPPCTCSILFIIKHVWRTSGRFAS